MAVSVAVGCVAPGRPAATPDWLEAHPRSDEYFIGIGGAPDTGAAAADFALAAQIATTITSEQVVISREDRRGGDATVESQIETLVDQNLEAVELVDSFHHVSLGYWFYYRLSKEQWDWIQNRDRYELRDRVGALVDAVFLSPEATVVDRLAALGGGLALLHASQVGEQVEGTLLGAAGRFLDILEAQLGVELTGVVLQVQPPSQQTLVGRPVDLHARVQSETGRVGRLPLRVTTSPGTSGVVSLITDLDGAARFTLATESLSPREHRVLVVLDLAAAGVPTQALTMVMSAPAATAAVAVAELRASLQILPPPADAPPLRVDAGFAERLRAVLASRLPVDFVPSGAGAPLTLTAAVQLRDGSSDFGIHISHAAIVFTATMGDRELLSYSSAEIKQGGLSFEQARAKAVAAVLRDEVWPAELSARLMAELAESLER